LRPLQGVSALAPHLLFECFEMSGVEPDLLKAHIWRVHGEIRSQPSDLEQIRRHVDGKKAGE
jgi:hypothetical protein